MSDNLAARLREVAINLSPSGSYWVCDELYKAADHIDRLEGALQLITDWDWSRTEITVEDIAYRALHGKPRDE